jgi:L-threonylcarbamoyladenylate synthase
VEPPTISLGDDPTEVVERVAAALTSGGAVVLPTDTVYGLAALPRDHSATAQLYDLKGRGAEAPLAVLCADVDQALELAEAAAGPAVRAVAARWWPGPLTLVLPRRIGVQLYLGEPSSTIGLRVPDHALVRAVAARVGPIAATSANRHGEPTATTLAGVLAGLGPGVALAVDGGALTAVASTVIDATGAPWRVLREGPVPGTHVLAVARHASASPGPPQG